MGRGPCHALLIEADEAYRAVIGACIQLVGSRVEPVSLPESALSALERQHFDLVVWSISQRNLMRRAELIAELRSRSQAQVIVLDNCVDTARADLEAGADQWVRKPFAPGMLIGSVRAAIRGSGGSTASRSLRTAIRGMLLDGSGRKLAYRDTEVSFTRQEWDLLAILFSHPDRFLGAQDILRLGWSAGEHAAEQLRTYVHRVRQKLDPLGLPCQLLSRHGQGYCLLFAWSPSRPD
jgi:DNA-binding response OmpR family regulator